MIQSENFIVVFLQGLLQQPLFSNRLLIYVAL
nr:MAG TPA: hypothetical protein [Caudoviricetes sp.]